jgi:hypothetical protein
MFTSLVNISFTVPLLYVQFCYLLISLLLIISHNFSYFFQIRISSRCCQTSNSFVARLEIFTLMKIYVIFWVMTPCNGVVRYQYYGGTCCLHLLALYGIITQKTTIYGLLLSVTCFIISSIEQSPWKADTQEISCLVWNLMFHCYCSLEPVMSSLPSLNCLTHTETYVLLIVSSP